MNFLERIEELMVIRKIINRRIEQSMNRIMKVKDITTNIYLINDKTDIQIYGYNDRYICHGNWYQDQILDHAEKLVKKLEYSAETNCCKITI